MSTQSQKKQSDKKNQIEQKKKENPIRNPSSNGEILSYPEEPGKSDESSSSSSSSSEDEAETDIDQSQIFKTIENPSLVSATPNVGGNTTTATTSSGPETSHNKHHDSQRETSTPTKPIEGATANTSSPIISSSHVSTVASHHHNSRPISGTVQNIATTKQPTSLVPPITAANLDKKITTLERRMVTQQQLDALQHSHHSIPLQNNNNNNNSSQVIDVDNTPGSLDVPSNKTNAPITTNPQIIHTQHQSIPQSARGPQSRTSNRRPVPSAIWGNPPLVHSPSEKNLSQTNSRQAASISPNPVLPVQKQPPVIPATNQNNLLPGNNNNNNKTTTLTNAHQKTLRYHQYQQPPTDKKKKKEPRREIVRSHNNHQI